MKKGDLVWFGFSVDTRNNKVLDWGLGIFLTSKNVEATAKNLAKINLLKHGLFSNIADF